MVTATTGTTCSTTSDPAIQLDRSTGTVTIADDNAGTFTTYTGQAISNPLGMAVGPDGNPWFTNYGNNSIGRITTGH